MKEIATGPNGAARAALEVVKGLGAHEKGWLDMGKMYIAYGSNMDLEQMRFRCPKARMVGKGMVTGYRLLFKGSKTGSYATIERKAGRKVPVLVWTVSESDECSLDRYEGCPKFYFKTEISVTVGKKRMRGMAYIMHEERALGVPSEYYYDVIARAYKKFGFDMRILEAALADTYLEGIMPDRKQIAKIKKDNPKGTRVRLVKMDDQQAPPIGTAGTVEGVDDIGNVLVRWETGSGLSLIPGVDEWEKIR